MLILLDDFDKLRWFQHLSCSAAFGPVIPSSSFTSRGSGTGGLESSKHFFLEPWRICREPQTTRNHCFSQIIFLERFSNIFCEGGNTASKRSSFLPETPPAPRILWLRLLLQRSFMWPSRSDRSGGSFSKGGQMTFRRYFAYVVCFKTVQHRGAVP